MHDELWAGVDRKMRNAKFHFDHMWSSILPPTGHMEAVLESHGQISDIRWQDAFYAHYDAFVSTTRSVAQILQCCFGHDEYRVLKKWFENLPEDEQTRRRDFRVRFDPYFKEFGEHPLGTARHMSEHRRGFAPLQVVIMGFSGTFHVGSPTDQIPASETRHIEEPELQFLARPRRVQPHWSDFYTDNGQPLYDACKEYLASAENLVAQARTICNDVHGSSSLTVPPSH